MVYNGNTWEVVKSFVHSLVVKNGQNTALTDGVLCTHDITVMKSSS